jgi:hypothetical protein
VKKAPGLIPAPLGIAMISGVSLLWGFDVLRHLLDDGHELNGQLGTVFATVVTFVLATYRKRGEPPDKDEPSEEPDEPDEPPPEEPEEPDRAEDEPDLLLEGATSVAQILARLAAEQQAKP